MADRTSANIFGTIFQLLADYEGKKDSHKQIARKLYLLSSGYDFTIGQMGCDKALVKLGIITAENDEDDEDV